jgi:hypothetical protein
VDLNIFTKKNVNHARRWVGIGGALGDGNRDRESEMERSRRLVGERENIEGIKRYLRGGEAGCLLWWAFGMLFGLWMALSSWATIPLKHILKG